MNVMVVLNYNDSETTIRFLKKTRDYSVLDKIIVVDNCSTDGSYERLFEFKSEKVDVVRTEKNEGYASGNNYGIKYAEKCYNPQKIVISNPDIEVSEESIRKICGYLDAHGDVAAATGLIYNEAGQVVSNYAWKLPTYSSILLDCFLLLSLFCRKVLNMGMRYQKPTVETDKIIFVDVLPGCFFVIKGEKMASVGYFDERTFLYSEESILAFKLKERGYRQVVLCDEPITHYGGVSVNKSIKSWRRKSKILESSRKVYLRNYLKVSELKVHLFVLLFNLGKYERYVLLRLRALVLRIKGRGRGRVSPY